jgi:hypothetical protein
MDVLRDEKALPLSTVQLDHSFPAKKAPFPVQTREREDSQWNGAAT